MTDAVGRDGRAGIDAALVTRLVAAQFPQWSHLTVRPVDVDGWDNRTYRLGDDMSVRLPTGVNYASAVDKEDRWLPFLAPLLPVPVPIPLARGDPGFGYPFHWSIRRWLDGQPAWRDNVGDLPSFASSVAGFLVALQRIDPGGGPPAGAHSFHRGTSPAHYDDETRRCLAQLAGQIDVDRASAVWDAALAASWSGPPVWFHGDVASGNLLVRDGRLAAVIDFGTSGIGDPACDLVIAWTLFSGDSRRVFRDGVGQDDACWARARGWALWKAALTLTERADTGDQASILRAQIDDVLADHEVAD